MLEVMAKELGRESEAVISLGLVSGQESATKWEPALVEVWEQVSGLA